MPDKLDGDMHRRRLGILRLGGQHGITCGGWDWSGMAVALPVYPM